MDSIIKILEEKKRQLEKDYLKKIEAIDNTIRIFSEDEVVDVGITVDSVKAIDSFNPYSIDVNNTLVNNVKYVVKNRDRFLHNREITEELIKVYDRDYKRLSRQISGILAVLKKRRELVDYRHGISVKNTYWGLPSWLGEDNKPLKKYMFFRKS